MARATGLEPATSSVTESEKYIYFSALIYSRHRLATSIDAQACKDAACRGCIIAFQQVSVHVQSGFDVFVTHESLYSLKVFAVGDENGRIEMT